MDQSSNILSYPELEPIGNSTPPHKYRKIKLAIYAIALLLIGFFIYSNYIQTSSSALTQPQTAGFNQTSPSPKTDSPTSYWDKSKIALPTYAPLTSSTDLHQATSEIDIPDFADQITALKELIAK